MNIAGIELTHTPPLHQHSLTLQEGRALLRNSRHVFPCLGWPNQQLLTGNTDIRLVTTEQHEYPRTALSSCQASQATK